MLPRIPNEVNWKFYVWLHMYASGGILITKPGTYLKRWDTELFEISEK
jgi:hypothetical protein